MGPLADGNSEGSGVEPWRAVLVWPGAGSGLFLACFGRTPTWLYAFGGSRGLVHGWRLRFSSKLSSLRRGTEMKVLNKGSK